MKYNFDKVINRKDSMSVKWDLADGLFGGTELLPLWVADMDFMSPPEVIDALVRRARHGIYGYTSAMMSYYDSVITWFKKRHSWEIRWDWIQFCPGVVPGLNILVQAFTEPGNGVIIQKPVYYPFMSSVENNGRRIINNPLVLEGDRYVMNLEDLEEKAADPNVRMMILCSPHNPVGRVWTGDELRKMGDICMRQKVLVVSDEIHCDLIYKGYRHLPYGSLGEEYLMNSIICTAPSKTFNLAGLYTSNLVIADEGLRGCYIKALKNLGIMGPNLFGAYALEAAYRYGEPWLNELMEYLWGNKDFLKAFVRERIPGVRVIDPEATYLAWLDFRELGLSNDELKSCLVQKARVALDYGYIFGSPEGDGFARINIACPRQILAEALINIEHALNSDLPASGNT